MRKSGEERRKLGEIDTQVFAERVAQYLRSRHPAKTALSVEIDTGIPAKTVSKWLDLTSAPSGKAYHRLLLTYPDLLCFVTPEDSPALFKHAARLAIQSDLEARAAAISAQLTDLRGQP